MDRVKLYEELLGEVKALIDSCDCPISNCANISSLLYNRLRSTYGETATNWTGFYFRSGSSTLQLGPFCGLPACQLLKFDKGVCGAAAAQKKTLLVPDVHDFPGHVACDEASNSELVIPIFDKDYVIGVLDMDCPLVEGFNEVDREYCEKIVKSLQEQSDFGKLRRYYQLE